MSLQGRLNSLVFVTALLAIVAFGLADLESGPVLLLLAAPGATIAWLLTRGPAGLTLPRWVVNGSVIVAVLYAIVRAMDAGAQVSGVCQLITIIQVIKFFDPKTSRDYSQRILLAIFLAIGAVLTSNDLPVGVVSLVFLPVSIAAIIVHQLYAGHEAVGRSRVAAGLPPPRLVAGRRSKRQFRAVVVACTFTGVAVGILVFLVLPRRLGAGAIGGVGRAGAGSVTGFVESITLGRAGILSESQAVVMDVAIRDAGGRTVGDPAIQYYMRGAILDEYAEGTWRRSTQAEGRNERNSDHGGTPLVFGERRGTVLEQEVMVRNAPRGVTYLFGLLRPLSVTGPAEVEYQYNRFDGLIKCQGPGGWLRYVVESSVADPASRTGDARSPAAFSNARIADLAGEVLTRAGIAPDPAARPVEEDFRAARAIERHLQGAYSYSLELRAPRAGEDPIEFFLFQSRSGNCEYFASAMAALCRAVGVPARVASGFLAWEYNPATESYTVRESDAHAWVEVEGGAGNWRQFDPSPPQGLRETRAEPSGIVAAMRRAYDAIAQIWVRSVVSFEGGRSRSPDAGGPGYESRLLRVGEHVARGGPRLIARSILRGASAALLVAMVCYAVLVAWRWAAQARGRRGASGSRRGALVEVRGYYGKLLAALARRGHEKPGSRPPLLHLTGIRDEALVEDARLIVRAYYGVRFAGRALDPSDRRAITAALERLAQPAPHGVSDNRAKSSRR